MRGKRFLHTIRLWMISSSKKRAEYMRKNEVFASMGDNCSIMDRKVPLYSGLIRIGNNVHMASNVSLITHDITHRMLNGIKNNTKAEYEEVVGCISIGDNVFIGTGAIILPNVNIGSNVIIGAGAIVTKDIPSNCVVGGVPAKVISDFESYCTNRKKNLYPVEFAPHGQVCSKKLEAFMWEQFEYDHK